MDAVLSGGCHCGALRFESTAAPMGGGHCQCTDCQKFSGTGHSSHLVLPRDAVTVTGPVKLYACRADSGNTVSRAFCPECGAPAYSLNSSVPDLIFLRPGTLDDPGRFTPQMVVWTDSGQPWDVQDPALKHYPRGSRG